MHPLFDSIADDIAQKGFSVTDHFLNEHEVADILQSGAFQYHQQLFRKAGIGKSEGHQVNEAIRGDYIRWIDRQQAEPSVRVYLDRLNDLVAFLNQALFLSLKDYEVHQTIYPIGTFYKRHLDQFKKDDHRKLSVICYLNKEWKESEGGQLRIYLEDGHVDVLPSAGRLVCFRSDMLEHEVLPATRERLSITGWILDQLADLRHL